ncbi:hypothetical protein [uncultured Winogradskyella sp.]|uniref:hypothetical protein n=1 Tax=uncultured Winogradskyella sp. TaxID=395353 RepID=UPI0030EDD716|tara:strand:- start:4733 stop:5275 length:543 start_codon:yes stop_codon:yes gene_type:complete
MLKINKLPFLIFIAFITFSTYNCGGIKPAATGKISKYVEDFFLGDGKMQYFVKPLEYVSTTEDESALDATFRRADKKNDSVTVNFSVLLNKNNTVNKVVIKNGESEYVSESIQTFFTQKEDEKILHRLSIKTTYADYKTYLLNQTHSITVSTKDESETISLTKKSKQNIEKIILILDDLL